MLDEEVKFLKTATARVQALNHGSLEPPKRQGICSARQSLVTVSACG